MTGRIFTPQKIERSQGSVGVTILPPMEVQVSGTKLTFPMQCLCCSRSPETQLDRFHVEARE